MTGKQLTLFITFKIQPDRIEEWKEAHRPVRPFPHLVNSRSAIKCAKKDFPSIQ